MIGGHRMTARATGDRTPGILQIQIALKRPIGRLFRCIGTHFQNPLSDSLGGVFNVLHCLSYASACGFVSTLGLLHIVRCSLNDLFEVLIFFHVVSS